MPTPEWSLRQCQRRDLFRISEIEKEAYGSSYPYLPMIAFVQYFELFSYTIVVAEKDDKIIGFAMAGQAMINKKIAWFLSNCVLEEYRNQKIGQSMVQWRIERLKRLGIELIKSPIAPENIASRRMLENCGFKFTREIANYFGDGTSRIMGELAI